MSDLIQRFIFEDADVRGELIRLDESYQAIINNGSYPEPVAKLLGDFITAAALLSETLKFDATLTLQARSEGDVTLIMAEATSSGQLRGIAKCEAIEVSEDLQTLLKNGQLSITVDPAKGKRYQGIVPLEGDNLASCIELYFKQSEQLSTRIWINSNEKSSAGLMLQELPASDLPQETRQQQWQHLAHLAETLSNEELHKLDFETLLHRLYHQDPLRLFTAKTLKFQCSCSEQRTASAIRALGRKEAESLIEEQGEIAIQCEFCHHDYRFYSSDLDNIFNPPLH